MEGKQGLTDQPVVNDTGGFQVRGVRAAPPFRSRLSRTDRWRQRWWAIRALWHLNRQERRSRR